MAWRALSSFFLPHPESRFRFGDNSMGLLRNSFDRIRFLDASTTPVVIEIPFPDQSKRDTGFPATAPQLSNASEF